MTAIKGQPLSIRLSAPTDRLVRDEARRTKRSVSAVVESLTEEAARMRHFPGIGFRGPDADRRAWVIGTGLDVWQVVEAYEDSGSLRGLVEETDLTERAVRLALAYRDRHPEEIAAAIAENRRPLEELRDLYPFVLVEPVEGPADGPAREPVDATIHEPVDEPPDTPAG